MCCSGGSHGGYGGGFKTGYRGGSSTYGSIFQPVTFGSGGYNGPGGGAIHLVVGNTLTIIGTLSSKGLDQDTGGGAGGSVWVETNAIAGTGWILANGAAAKITNGPSAGGGRVAIYSISSSFMGSIKASGGSMTATADGPFKQGSAGTVYLDVNHTRILIIDNGAAPVSNWRTSLIRNNETILHFDSIYVEGNSDLNLDEATNANLTVMVGQLASNTRTGIIHIGGNSSKDRSSVVNVTVNGAILGIAVDIFENGILTIATPEAVDASLFATLRSTPGLDVYHKRYIIKHFFY